MYSIDYETKSRSDLNEVGAFRYAKDPSTEVLCVSVCKDDGPVLVWIPPEFETRCDVFGDVVSDPGAKELLLEVMSSDEPMSAFNVMFEISITENVLCRLHGFPVPKRNRWRCTQVMARRANIPSSLAKAADCLKLKHQKDAAGGRLINKFSIPQKDTNEFIHPRKDPEAFKSFAEYCRQDTEVERELYGVLKPFELAGWILGIFLESIEINCRGMPLNLDALHKANAMIEQESVPAFAAFRELTGLNPTQNAKVKAWINANGLTLDNLQGDTLDAVMAAPVEPGQEKARQAIELMQKMGFASVKKIPTMLACAGPDDNAIRGSLEFHGASTMRWSAKLHQPQNFKSPEEWAEFLTGRMYADLCNGESKGDLEWWYGKPIFSILANCIRHFIQDAQGPMLSADYTAIEAMILAWIAGEEWRLEVFRTHKKIYEMSASQMFGIPMQEFEDYKKQHGKHHPMRKTGKVAELACIAEGQLVTTDHGLVPIERVTLGMKVWDGISFVSHQGVVYQGIKEVLTYENLTATEDHIVFTEAGPVQFADAARWGQHLLKSGPSRKGVWLGESDFSLEGVCETQVAGMPSADRMPRMRKGVMAEFLQSPEGGVQRVPALLAAKAHSNVATQQGIGYGAKMQQPSEPWVLQLRGERYRVPFRVTAGGVPVDTGKPWVAPGVRVGPNQQRRSLRAGESEVRHPFNAEFECSNHQDDRGMVRVVPDQKPLRFLHLSSSALSNAEHGEGDRVGHGGSHHEAQVLEDHPRPAYRTRVYDILNCGPRNRFTVSGVLVHNCGYQGAEGALIKFGALDMGLKQEDLQPIVDKWRAANPNITDFWYACERAAIRAVKLPGQKMVVGKLTFFSARVAGANYLFMKLPSGRNLAYRDPKVTEVKAVSKKTGNEYTKSSLSYYGQIPGPSGAKSTKWGNVSLYGGKITENACQAIAFDIMANGVLKAAAKGYRIYSLIHDEALAAFDGPYQSLQEFQSCLEDVPRWCDGLPVSTSGEVVPYYKK